jgi:20S proteasome subunit alpha 6
MFRNQYDTDATTFSPAGRLHQVEYAGEAVKQGSATVGVRSKEAAVIVSLKRSESELASYQKKTFKIDDHCGISISGLIADARQIAKYLQDECLNHRYVYETPMLVGRLVRKISDKSQVYTQKSEKRPYGVGLLVVGYDKTGPHLFQTAPSGNYYEYYAQAIGARSQAAKTYLEKVYESFPEASLDDLIKHALTALKGNSSKPLTSRSCTIAFVGAGHNFKILEGNEIKPYVVAVTGDEADESGDEEEDDEEDDDDEKGDGKEKTISTTTLSGGPKPGEKDKSTIGKKRKKGPQDKGDDDDDTTMEDTEV